MEELLLENQKQIQKSVPKSWVLTTIHKISDVIGGGTPKTNDDSNYEGGNIPWISPADLSNYTDVYIERGKKNITEKGLKGSSARLLPKHSVLFSSRAPIGYVAIAKNELATNQGFKSMKPSLAYYPKFAYWYLKSAKSLAEANASGTTFLEISGRRFGDLPFPLPPLAEQKRIVAKLDALMEKVDAARERLEAIPGTLKQFRQRVLAHAVSGKLTEEWRKENTEVESGDTLLARIKTERISRYEEVCKAAKKAGIKAPQFPRGYKPSNSYSVEETMKIPESWIWTSIDLIGDVNVGGTPSRNAERYWGGNINWVSSGEVANNLISTTRETITEEGLHNSSVKIYPVGTLLIAMIGEGKTRGQVALLEIEAGSNQNVAAITTMPHLVNPMYLWYFLQSAYERNRGEGRGGNQPALNGIKVGGLGVSLPPFPEQKEIVRKIEELFSWADGVEEASTRAIKKLERLPQALLAKAFRGELVPQDPSDEPASLLLERIKAEREKQSKGKSRKGV